MKLLCIAEKPSVMREIEAVYKKHGCSKGIIDFAAFHGHLMKLPTADFYDPKYKKWEAADLPIIPDFQYVEDDVKSCKQLVDRIKKGNYDALINACDAGREGEHIFYSFYEGEHLTLPVLRFWASDVTEESLHKALENLIDEKQFRGLRESAKLRAKADWLVGINLSRASTICSDTKVPIGRVQSPTLALIVERELEIRNFVPKDYFEVMARFETGSNEIYDSSYLIPPDLKDNKFAKKEDAEAVLAKLAKEGTVDSVTASMQKTNAPSLYSLVELQKDGAKFFGFKADKTLSLAQSLYETHKVLTYPRTESRFLPTAMVSEIWDHLAPINEIPELQSYYQGLDKKHVDDIMHSKSYVDNAKITDHHAIIPTKIKPNFSKMSEDEKKVYLMVCKRLLAIFMPPYEVEKTKIITKTDDGSMFVVNGKVVKEKGFSVLYPSKAKDVVLPAVKKGDRVKVKKTGIVSGQTKPPARYNTSTLLTAMQNVGQQLSSAEMRQILRDTAGLGTSATRAEILKKLEAYNFVVIQRQCYVPTDFGIAVVENFGKHNVFSAEMTAKWESKLKDVEENNLDPQEFYKELIEYTKSETQEVLQRKCNLSKLSLPIVGKCPICGKPLRSMKNYFVCEDYKHNDHPCAGCFNKTFFGHRITDAEMRGILTGKPTKVYELKSEKNTWKAGISFDFAKNRFCFAQAKESDRKSVNADKIDERGKVCKCPMCGGSIVKGKNYYVCDNRSNGCKFICGTIMSEYLVTEDDIKEICKDGHTATSKQFKWKSGKTGSAKLILKSDGMVSYDFGN